VAYEPNFYQAQNIVGYTGEIGKSPTVYFMDSRYYGHSTQDHPCPMNVGRETIHPLITSPAQGSDINGMVLTYIYRATNDPKTGNLVEWYEKVYSPERTQGGRRGRVMAMGYANRVQIHPSRSPFKTCDNKSRPALEEALQLEEAKERYSVKGQQQFAGCCGAYIRSQGKQWTKCNKCPF
jgi:hypothetical protein